MKDYLRRAKVKLKEALLISEISVSRSPISLTTSRTGFGGTRYWFVCPLCSHRVGVLFVHPTNNITGCRTCLNLEYRNRRFKGMVENSI